MKKLLMAVAILALVALNNASAEMVNIGLGQMEQSEFADLKAMVQGRQTSNKTAISIQVDRPERYGLMEMSYADFKDLRDKVAGRKVIVEGSQVMKTVQMVNIGTGEMSMEEFIVLKRMVEKPDAFKSEHLATVMP